MTYPHYDSCAMCKQSFDAEQDPALFEDGLAYCASCAYEISQFQAPTAA